MDGDNGDSEYYDVLAKLRSTLMTPSGVSRGTLCIMLRLFEHIQDVGHAVLAGMRMILAKLRSRLKPLSGVSARGAGILPHVQVAKSCIALCSVVVRNILPYVHIGHCIVFSHIRKLHCYALHGDDEPDSGATVEKYSPL